MRGSGDYDRKKKETGICLAGCAVVLCQFLVLAGNWKFFCCGGKFLLRVLAITTGKKRYSHLSGGLCCCISFWFWREISIFFVVAGNFDYDRKKKIQSSSPREVFFFSGRNNDCNRKKKIPVIIKFVLVQLN